MNDQPEEFEDPAFKAALQRLRGGHTASADLRERVAASLNAARSKPAVARRKTPAIIWWAAAACLVLGLFRGYAYWQDARERSHRQAPAYFSNNVELIRDMVRFHETPASHAELAVSTGTSISDLKSRAEKEFGRPVPSPVLGADWTLVRAGVNTFRTEKTSRFDFTRGSTRITLISFPSDHVQAANDGQSYDVIESNHPIAGYCDRGTMHCLIGDAGMPLAEVVALRDRLRAQ